MAKIFGIAILALLIASAAVHITEDKEDLVMRPNEHKDKEEAAMPEHKEHKKSTKSFEFQFADGVFGFMKSLFGNFGKKKICIEEDTSALQGAMKGAKSMFMSIFSGKGASEEEPSGLPKLNTMLEGKGATVTEVKDDACGDGWILAGEEDEEQTMNKIKKLLREDDKVKETMAESASSASSPDDDPIEALTKGLKFYVEDPGTSASMAETEDVMNLSAPAGEKTSAAIDELTAAAASTRVADGTGWCGRVMWGEYKANRKTGNPGIDDVFIFAGDSVKDFIDNIAANQNPTGARHMADKLGFPDPPTGNMFLAVWKESGKHIPISVETIPDWLQRNYGEEDGKGYVYQRYRAIAEDMAKETKATGFVDSRKYNNARLNSDCQTWADACLTACDTMKQMCIKGIQDKIGDMKGNSFPHQMECIKVLGGRNILGYAKGVSAWMQGGGVLDPLQNNDLKKYCGPQDTAQAWELRTLMSANGFFPEWLGTGKAGLSKEMLAIHKGIALNALKPGEVENSEFGAEKVAKREDLTTEELDDDVANGEEIASMHIGGLGAYSEFVHRTQTINKADLGDDAFYVPITFPA